MINLLTVIDNPDPPCVYFAAPVRGIAGDNATEEEINRNIEEDLGVADWLRGHFPGIIWIIPHEHEIIIREACRDNIEPERIVLWWKRVACKCKAMVVYDRHGISNGMQAEIDVMIGKPVVYMDATGEEAETDIAAMIASIL